MVSGVPEKPKPPHCYMTPDLHRERAAELRRNGSPRALMLAEQHEMLARVIEKRLGGEVIMAPPLVPPNG